MTTVDNPLDDVRPLDPTGGAIWLLLAAAVLGAVAVWLLWRLVTAYERTPWHYGAVALCVLATVALWPLRGAVNTDTAPLGQGALGLLPVALLAGFGLAVWALVANRR